MEHLAGVIAAIVAALAPLGAAVTWLWNKIERRFEQIEHDLAACRDRERRSLERRGVQLTVIELLFSELGRVAPDTPLLRQAREMLSDLKLKVLADQVDDAVDRAKEDR